MMRGGLLALPNAFWRAQGVSAEADAVQKVLLALSIEDRQAHLGTKEVDFDTDLV